MTYAQIAGNKNSVWDYEFAMSFAAASLLIDRLEASWRQRGGEVAVEVLQRLAEQDISEAAFTQPKPATLPVVRYYKNCAQGAEGLLGIEPHLQWRQSSYTDAQMGDGFTANYGWCQLIGPRGFFPGHDFLLGLLMLGPHQHYRDHYHPAPELYWPLTGGTQWRREPDGFTEKPAGSLIWHRPNQIHAMKTGDQPLLAVWCWTRDTNTPARPVVQPELRMS